MMHKNGPIPDGFAGLKGTVVVDLTLFNWEDNMAPRTLDQAILITWGWSGEHAAREDKIAAILPPGLDTSLLALLVETLYNHHTATSAEMARYVQEPDTQPYKAEYAAPRSSGAWLRCGDNPYLEARTVRHLTVEVSEDYESETITWEEQMSDGDWESERFTQRTNARWRDSDGDIVEDLI
jgi:hypothetical protein